MVGDGEIEEKAMAEPVRLILDTDVGDDVDDAFAIAQAALHPGIELVAVTTCYGDTGFRARLATVVLESLGAGATLVLAGPERRFTDGSAVSTRMQSGEGFVEETGGQYGDAVEYLLEAVMSEPGTITVCAVGPLTNIATAMERDTGFAAAMKQLVIMGGSVPQGEEDQDYNFYCDPGAAVAVLNSEARIRLGPLQVTRRALFETEHREQLLETGSALAPLLTAMFDQYVERRERTWTPLFDPATLGTIYDDSFVKMKRRRLRAVLFGESVRLEEGGGEVEVIEEVDGPGFVGHLVELLGTAS
jgi:inosine-uridine nucleoside N-ribohydrolase